MNKIEKGKKGLKGLSIGMMVFGFLLLAVGVAGIIFGVVKLQETFGISIVFIVIGGIIGILGLIIGIFGLVYYFVSRSLVATKGSVAEENLGKGTENGKVCPKCGLTNTPDTEKCTSCGADLEK